MKVLTLLPVALAFAAIAWTSLFVRYFLKLPKGRVRTMLAVAPLAPVGAFLGAMIKGFPLALTVWLIGSAALVPWLATNFKPERMIDAKYLYGEEAVTDEQERTAEKYQLRAIGLVVVGVIVAVIFVR